MKLTITSKDILAEALQQAGLPLDLRCGGRGICGRCAVRLLSGIWDVDGKPTTAPATALACRTRLISDAGDVECSLPEQKGKIASDWQGVSLPVSAETVIGIDLGTTTVAAVKVKNGQILTRATAFNAQMAYGDNVITRIERSGTELQGLQEAILKTCRELLQELGTDDVTRLAVAGNTVMTCIFHGIDPTPIGHLPFTPPARFFQPRWDLLENLELLTVPCISGYVGGDLTAGVWETHLNTGEMLVDIGTNCEIVFNTPEGMVCTAAAAGPAFEGAGLNFGCRAQAGAIDHYRSDMDYSVIGNVAPSGFCGSGFIDLLAAEHRLGRLSDMGRWIPAASKRFITDEIFIHEQDIEQLLKAKAAVWAGINTLEAYCHLQASKIYLAGGFARFLDIDNAIAIGMLPQRQYERVGNTSLAGAVHLALQPELQKALEELCNLPREIPLNDIPDFEDNFIDGLMLP